MKGIPHELGNFYFGESTFVPEGLNIIICKWNCDGAVCVVMVAPSSADIHKSVSRDAAHRPLGASHPAGSHPSQGCDFRAILRLRVPVPPEEQGGPPQHHYLSHAWSHPRADRFHAQAKQKVGPCSNLIAVIL